MSRIPVVIYGAGGYGGVGLVENLLAHPGVEIAAVVSREGAGKPYSDIYPHLKGKMDRVIEDAATFSPKGRGRLVFFSTPDGVGQALAEGYLAEGYRIIDFSGDFRFGDNAAYRAYSAWQQGEADHKAPQLLAKSVYGVPELHRAAIKTAPIVGNPGCMAIASTLAVAPAMSDKLVDKDSLVLNALTGISGAGKKLNAKFHYPAAYANAYAYKVGKHQHVFEMERELARLAGGEVRVNFTPHVIPVSRGILVTASARLVAGIGAKEVEAAYRKHYGAEPFLRLEFGGSAQLDEVRGTNFMKLSVQVSERTRTLVVLSAIDNLQKGQAGNAVQNLNLMLGFDEKAGLDIIPRYP